jgi:hypothetical protein
MTIRNLFLLTKKIEYKHGEGGVGSSMESKA